MLWLEVLLVVFAALTLFGLGLVDPVTLAIGGGALALSMAVAAGLQGRPEGLVVGSVLQVPLPAVGVATGMPVLVVVGLLFAVLWVVAVRLGGRIDRERAERDARDGGATGPG